MNSPENLPAPDPVSRPARLYVSASLAAAALTLEERQKLLLKGSMEYPKAQPAADEA